MRCVDLCRWMCVCVSRCASEVWGSVPLWRGIGASWVRVVM